eukprot:8432-Eustigmatos_ZCMA.PRE.1
MCREVQRSTMCERLGSGGTRRTTFDPHSGQPQEVRRHFPVTQQPLAGMGEVMHGHLRLT